MKYLIDAVTKDTQYVTGHENGTVFGIRDIPSLGMYNNYHIGNDYNTPEGVRLYAPLDGVYLKTVRDGVGDGYGNYILFYIPSMDITLHFAHLNHIEWYEGKGTVKAGTYIGNTGNTGTSTAPHLHLGVARGKKYDTVKGRYGDGTWIDPSTIMIKEPAKPAPAPSKPKFQFAVGDVLEISGHYPTVHNGNFISTPRKHVTVKKIFPKDHYPYQVTDEKGNILGGVDPVNVYRVVRRKPAPSPSKPKPTPVKEIKEGSFVTCNAKKDIHGTSLDESMFDGKRKYKVIQVGRNGNKNHILLDGVYTWVDKSTAKVV